MKIVFVHISLKVYWIPRLFALHNYCRERGISLTVIEILGSSNVYTFDKTNLDSEDWWKCLFPDRGIDEVAGKDITKSLESALSEVDPDIVVAGPIAYPCGAVSLRWANKNRRKMITFDDIRADNLKRSWFVNFVKRQLYKRIDGYFAPSPSYLKDLKQWGFHKDNVFYGLNCIDNQFFSKRTDDEISEYQFKGINPEKSRKYLICVARFVPVKNHINLLSAWQRFVNDKNKDGLWELLLVGEGPLHSDMLNYVSDKDIPFVTFLGAIPQSELPFYYSISSAAICPSTRESWGLVVNEAMAAGLPVLISKECNCAGDLLMENINGFSFSPGSVGEISETLDKLVETQDLEAMGKKSLEIIREYDVCVFSRNLVSGAMLLNRQPAKKASFLESSLIGVWDGRFSLEGFNGTPHSN